MQDPLEKFIESFLTAQKDLDTVSQNSRSLLGKIEQSEQGRISQTIALHESVKKTLSSLSQVNAHLENAPELVKAHLKNHLDSYFSELPKSVQVTNQYKVETTTQYFFGLILVFIVATYLATIFLTRDNLREKEQQLEKAKEELNYYRSNAPKLKKKYEGLLK